MYHRSLALALTAFLLVALVRVPAVSADDTQDKALESLDCWVQEGKTTFVVKNMGEVSAQVTSIKYSINGNQYWEDIIPDVPLISYESHIFPISHEYDTIGVLSARGVLYPVKLRPTASFDYSPSSPRAGETVSFDASASSDPDGTIVSYEWDLDGDGAYDDATSVATTKIFAGAGVYAIGLEVTGDDDLTGSTTRTITVEISDTVIEGTTEPNAPVTIIVSSETKVYEIVADGSGYFSVVVPDLSAGTHNVTIVAGDANRNRQADGPYTGGWEGYAEKEKTDSVEAGSSVYFNLSLTYDSFNLSLSPTSSTSAQGWQKTTTTGTISDPFQDTREVIARYGNGDIIYQTVKDSLIGYNFEQRVTEYTTVTSSLSASAGEWVDTGKTVERWWPNQGPPEASQGCHWVKTGDGWCSTFYKEQYNEVEDWKAFGYSVTSNYDYKVNWTTETPHSITYEEYSDADDKRDSTGGSLEYVWDDTDEWVSAHWEGGYDYKVEWNMWNPGYYIGGYDYKVDWTEWDPYHDRDYKVKWDVWVPGYYTGGNDYRVDWNVWIPGYYVGGYDYSVDWTTSYWDPTCTYHSGYWSGCYKTRSVRYWNSKCTYHSGYWSGCYKNRSVRYWNSKCTYHSGYWSGCYKWGYSYGRVYQYWEPRCTWHSGYWSGCYKYKNETYWEPRCTWHPSYWSGCYKYKDETYWEPNCTWYPGHWHGCTKYESHSQTYDHYSDASAKKSATGGTITSVWNSYDTWISGYYDSHSQTFNYYSDASAKKSATGGTLTYVWDPYDVWHSGYYEEHSQNFDYYSDALAKKNSTSGTLTGYWVGAYEDRSQTFDEYSDASAKKSATGGSITYVWDDTDVWHAGHYEECSQTYEDYSDADDRRDATGGSLTFVWDDTDEWVSAHWEGGYDYKVDWTTESPHSITYEDWSDAYAKKNATGGSITTILAGYTASKQVSYKTWVPKFSEEEPDIFSEDIRDVQKLWSYKNEPVMTTETYTRYHVYSFEDITYSPLSWSSKQTKITATWLNGYTGEINLSVNPDGLGYSLDEDVLSFGSSASATLTLTPTSASTHYVKVNAYDSNGHQEARSYALSCTSNMPEDSYNETFIGDSDEKPNESAETITVIHTETVDVEPQVSISVNPSSGSVFWTSTLNYWVSWIRNKDIIPRSALQKAGLSPWEETDDPNPLVQVTNRARLSIDVDERIYVGEAYWSGTLHYKAFVYPQYNKSTSRITFTYKGFSKNLWGEYQDMGEDRFAYVVSYINSVSYPFSTSSSIREGRATVSVCISANEDSVYYQLTMRARTVFEYDI